MNLGWSQIWGSGVVLFGLVAIKRQNIPVGIEGRPASFYLTGKKAIFVGVIAIFIGLMVFFEIPSSLIRNLDIDKCLDSGGKWDYFNDKCLYEE